MSDEKQKLDEFKELIPQIKWEVSLWQKKVEQLTSFN